MVRAILFDWGRTLFDSERGALFPEAVAVVERLSRTHTLAIVSLATGDNWAERVEARRGVLRESGIEPYFARALFDPADKDRLYAEALAALGVRAGEVAIVDDRAARGVRWGNRHGAVTVWLRRGKFARELPGEETGRPTHTIGSLAELVGLL